MKMLLPGRKTLLKQGTPEPNGTTTSPQRRKDAETSAEKTEARQKQRTQRKRRERRNAGWRHRPCAEVGTCFGARGGSFALLLVAALLHPAAPGATRPQYGGTLRVELRQNAETPDPPALLGRGFTIARWEAGRLAVYESDENAGGGRPFLGSVEFHLGRALRDQASDLDLGKADVVELGPGELRRQPAGRRIWSSSPVRVLALVFAPRYEDARVREALALAVDRSAIHTVLLQRQGEISGALLPQWLSGYAFLFPAAADLGRARQLAPGARPITLGVSDAAARPIAERIALNARDAGLAELRIASADPAKALAQIAEALGLPAPQREASPNTAPNAAANASPEQAYAAERALLEGFRVIPLILLPDVYGVGARVKGGPGIAPSGEWRFDNLWLEGARP